MTPPVEPPIVTAEKLLIDSLHTLQSSWASSDATQKNLLWQDVFTKKAAVDTQLLVTPLGISQNLEDKIVDLQNAIEAVQAEWVPGNTTVRRPLWGAVFSTLVIVEQALVDEGF